MPICKRDGFDSGSAKNKNQTFHDNDDVFFCEITKEIFRDYDDYFRHVMSINSTVWQCEATGREHLTYAEALKSESRARKKMELFKDSLRPPVMLVIEQAKQSSIKQLTSIVFKFIRRRFFLKEEVQGLSPGGKYLPYDVAEIIPIEKSSFTNNVYNDTDKLKYKLRRYSEGILISEVTLTPDNIRRTRSELTLDNLEMFIKSNVSRIDGILRAKSESYKKYVTDRKITFDNIFIGKMPQFSPAKIKKQTSIKSFVTQNEAKEAKEAKKRWNEAQQVQRALAFKEEMLRTRQEKQERLIEEERLKAERRAKLIERIDEECNEMLNKSEDLERIDQRLIPKFKTIQTENINPKLLDDCFILLEFVQSFSSVISGLEAIGGELKLQYLIRVITQHEVSGPLSDLVRILLATIFDLQKEEAGEYDVSYTTNTEISKREPYKTMLQASKTHTFAKRHYAVKLNELPLDAMTLSEVLRLHLLSSGAYVMDRTDRARANYRNGYGSLEDPGFTFRKEHPNVLHNLRMYTLYQLPMVDITRILRCLISQILTYSPILNIIEDRMEQSNQLRLDLRILALNEQRRLTYVHKQKSDITNEYQQKRKDPAVRQDAEKKLLLETEYNKRLDELQAAAERERRNYDRNVERKNKGLFNYITYLGMDRAYRKYYIFESMPGLFIEHSNECYDACLDNPPKNVTLAEVNKRISSNLPKNRKDLRAFLLKKYTDEAKNANKTIHNNNNNNNNDIKKLLIANENKENQQQQQNELTNGHLVDGVNDVHIKSEGASAGIKVETSDPTQYELYMCTGDPNNCIVHDPKNKDRQHWAFIYEKHEIDELIESLNPLGERESQLREQILSLRELIILHAKKCPVDALSKLSRNKGNNSSFRRWGTFDENADLNEVMHESLVHRIIQFEKDIYTGDLGRLKVKDMVKWRQDLCAGTYDPQVKLQWGQEETTNYSDDDEDEDDEYLFSGNKNFIDPGVNLAKNMEIDSEESTEEIISLHESTTLRNHVKNLASALLQVEQAIERRFLKDPFGAPLKNNKDKDIVERKKKQGLQCIKRWEISLMECTSYSQVFLHLNILHDNIAWARSTAKSFCQVCRRGTDPDKMLLCDNCNGGTHMFCMKPKMKTVPEGNWYCHRCVESLELPATKPRAPPRRRGQSAEANEEDDSADSRSEISNTSSTSDRARRIAARRRGKALNGPEIEDVLDENEENEDDEENEQEEAADSEEEDVETDEEEEYEEADKNADVNEESNEAENENDENDNDDDNVCVICSYDGGDLFCVRCKDVFHLECASLKRPPRYNFVCAKCKVRDDKKRKLKHNDSTEDEDMDFQSNSEVPTKRSRHSRASLRNSANGVVNEAVKTSGRRSHRRTSDDLPLNSPILYSLLEDIMKHEQSWPFLRPVMQSEVPDYYKIIKYPMDFAKVKSKLNMGKYQLNEEVMSDMQLVFNNCDQYNVKGNEIYDAGCTLEQFVMKRCRDLNLPFKPSDMNA